MDPYRTIRHNPTVHHRRSVRVSGYDYSSAGYYFVTICIWNRQLDLGNVVEGLMQPN